MKRIFVAIDRTSKVAFAELYSCAKRVVAAEFLRRVLNRLPYKVELFLNKAKRKKNVMLSLSKHLYRNTT
ncbi:hypothetical protein [Hymenobacter elongatus]|uniref:Uncharacterized protein n=1 Tax=Hymenobacter elongatus TaxID=877208 RepID=A0A4Z0PQ86_9BACT|nr:hypothetical protein [Hymenobacter elongatus]TGE18043.1 hypothetical protein E5J99_05765 [Hymenobacter elongatus]